MYAHPRTRIVALIVYNSANSRLIADAHNIPLKDALVVQAELEHVLQPRRVVAEIWRVLRPGGIVYVETPFMHHVHEGPFDFTRFTESGHRYLFSPVLPDAFGDERRARDAARLVDRLFARGLFRSRRVASPIRSCDPTAIRI
ncbi:methyltransferase domain-containing protein [Aureimonas sp. SA4125]|uniref:methyltransferase domain-containing protein n=1 Tax=Aureimonas sp. SA4125 TaxID=2826993 RepID=UPI001CC76FB6|nr:methyltransferase domain-containing protein [Aureimonas sp. SA4125]